MQRRSMHEAHIMSTRGAHYVGLVRLDARGRWQVGWVEVEVVGFGGPKHQVACGIAFVSGVAL
jgi:hypothetical protein